MEKSNRLQKELSVIALGLPKFQREDLSRNFEAESPEDFDTETFLAKAAWATDNYNRALDLALGTIERYCAKAVTPYAQVSMNTPNWNAHLLLYCSTTIARRQFKGAIGVGTWNGFKQRLTVEMAGGASHRAEAPACKDIEEIESLVAQTFDEPKSGNATPLLHFFNRRYGVETGSPGATAIQALIEINRENYLTSVLPALLSIEESR